MSKTKPIGITVRQWDDPVYGIQHRVLYCTEKQAQAYATKYFDFDLGLDGNNRSAMTFSLTHNGQFIVNYWFDRDIKFNTVGRLALIAHEASHGCDHVFKRLGIPTGLKTSEPRAYYLDTIVGTLCRMLKLVPAKRKR